MTYYREVTYQKNANAYLRGLEKDTLIIYTPAVLAHLDTIISGIHLIDSRIFRHDLALLDVLCDSHRNYNQVVGIGGGSAIDIAKYIATRMNTRLVCIPSVLSTNSFATNQAELMSNEERVVVATKLADEIIFDPNLIKKAAALNLYGLADVLSIHTALFDWQLAKRHADESLNEGIYRMAEDHLAVTSAFIGKTNPHKLLGSVEQIFTSIGESGHLCSIYNSSRPQSGSEHIFARKLGERTNAPHGVNVSIGIGLMSLLQQNKSPEIFACLKTLGTLKNLTGYGIGRQMIKDALLAISPQPGRYTIIDKEKITSLKAERLLLEFEQSVTSLPHI